MTSGTGGRDTRIPWRRSATEFVVIVVGVLVALAADAAWDAREELEAEARYLRQLTVELEATQARLEQAVAREQSALDRGALLLDNLNGARRDPADSLRAWTRAISVSSLFVPALATVTTLVETGDLRLIRHAELRANLVLLLQAETDHRRRSDLVDENLLRTLEQLGTRYNLNAIGSAEWQSLTLQIDWEAAASDVEFHSRVFLLRNSARNRLSALNRLSRSLEAAQASVQAALSAEGLS